MEAKDSVREATIDNNTEDRERVREPISDAAGQARDTVPETVANGNGEAAEPIADDSGKGSGEYDAIPIKENHPETATNDKIDIGSDNKNNPTTGN